LPGNSILYLKVSRSRLKINGFVMCLVVKQNAVFVTEFVHITPFSEAVHTYRLCY